MIATTEQLMHEPAGSILRDCIATLEHVANDRLPAAMDRRLRWLSENKDSLTSDERDELLALVDFAEDRTLDKVKARVTLQRLGELLPQLFLSRP